MSTAVPMRAAADLAVVGEVEQFLYHEARLADEHDYVAWEALWSDDGVYWVPGAGDDPDRAMSVIYDNRGRLATRLKQLRSGKRHAQVPPSRLRRVISNVEITCVQNGEIAVGANFVVAELRERGTELWVGRYEYILRRESGGELRIAQKKVLLINRDQPLYTLAFLI